MALPYFVLLMLKRIQDKVVYAKFGRWGQFMRIHVQCNAHRRNVVRSVLRTISRNVIIPHNVKN